MDTKFQHKSLPIIIGYSEYSKLSVKERNDFVIVNSSPAEIKNITTVTNNTKTDDLLGLGKATETVVGVALIPFALLGLFD